MNTFARLFAILIVCNGIDLVCTTLFLEKGLAYESNPLMAILYHASPVYFAAMKILLVTAGGAILYWRIKASGGRWTVPATALLFYTIVYAGIAAYQMSMLFHWLSAG